MDRKLSDNAVAIATMALGPHFAGLTPEVLKTALSLVQTGAKEPAPDRLISAVEGARLLGISRRTFDRLGNDGPLTRVRITPAHTRKDGREIGGLVRFRLSDVQKFGALAMSFSPAAPAGQTATGESKAVR
jgi:predicted DNA-binding transcriptional regulator AlpA